MTRPESSQPTRYVFLRGWASAADVATASTLPETTAAALDGGGAGTEGDVARGASDAAPGRVAGGASPTMGSARVPAAGAFGFGGVRAGAGSAAVSGADCASGVTTDARGASNPQAASTEIDVGWSSARGAA